MRDINKFHWNIFIRLLMMVTGFLIMTAAGTRNAAAADKSLYIDDDIQTLYTAEDGLLSTSSTAVAQSSDGFIWIGGYGGLVRYDGRSFVPYGNGKLSNVTGILADTDGVVWIASADEGLVRYDDDELTYLMLGEGGESSSVQCLARAPSGAVWLGTDDGIGVFYPETGVYEKREIPDVDGKLVTRILCVSDSEIVFVLRSGTLRRYDGERCEQIDLGELSEQVRTVSMSVTGDFYIGTSGDLVLRCDSDFGIMEEIETAGLSTINDILYGSAGEVWICSDTGIGVYQAGSLKIQHLLMDNSIDHMMIDEEGNYWFVSSRQGILKVSESLFGNVSQSAGLSTMVVNAVVRLDNRLYVGHDDGLAILDLDTYSQIEDADFERLKSVRIRCIYLDSEDNLWFCTKGEGVLRRGADRTWKVYSSASYPVIASDNFRCIIETEDGFIAGSDVGAYRIRGDEVENVAANPDDLARRVLSIAVDGETGYFGTDGYGIFIVENGEVVRHITTENGLNSNVIMKFAKSRENDAIWMVTGNEIAWIDKEAEIHHIEDFPSLNNLDFLALENGEVWIPSGNGIFLTTEDALLRGDTGAIRLYQRGDGLPFDITANSYQCVDGETVYLCGSGGIISLKTGSEALQHGDYQLTITDILEDGKKRYVHGLDEYVVDQTVQRIEIGAYVLTYGTEDPEVFYYLEGFDNERIARPLSELNGFSYTNLDGGEYVFHFGILDEESREVKQEVTLGLIKEFKWYETKRLQIGALVAALALLGLLVYLFMRIHTRRVQKRLTEEYERLEKLHLQEIAYKDYLTGLYNRNYLEVWNETILPAAGYPITFITIDCNGLKRINDNFGHRAGDQLLKTLAELLQEAFQDARFTIFRNGGDEFLVLCTATEREEAERITGELRKRAAECAIGDGPVTFCAGFSTMTEADFDFDEGLRQSDEEMLVEKAGVYDRRR